MFAIITIPLMAFLSRLSGGGFFAPWLANIRFKSFPMFKGFKFLPELLFALCIALLYVSNLWVAAFVWIYSYFAKESGHDVVLAWGQPIHPEQAKKTARTTPIVNWMATKLKIPLYMEDGMSRPLNYCRLFMAFKGFLIGLPMFPLGLLLIILHPLAYEIQERYIKKDGLEEILSGAFAGLILGVLL